MKQRKQHYYSKLLLFGEYSILFGSSALSIPYSHFQAELSFIREDKYTDLEQAQASNRMLKELAGSLVRRWDKAAQVLDLKRLEAEIAEGLYLESTIPQGYGLGSSGALCAALYERFALKRIMVSSRLSRKHISQLRNIFAGMESFFHGKSSGIDPLGIYLGSPLFIPAAGKPEMVGIPRNWDNRKSGIFLLDTGRPGKTANLVPDMLAKFVPEGQVSTEGKELCRLTDTAIASLLRGEMQVFWDTLIRLSDFQFERMSILIPDLVKKWWTAGRESGLFSLKICGSGGGGFITGFARDYPKAQAFMKKEGLQTIPVYLAS